MDDETDYELVPLNSRERKVVWNHRKARWIGKKYIEEVSEFAAQEGMKETIANAANVVPITQLKCVLPDTETTAPFQPNMIGE